MQGYLTLANSLVFLLIVLQGGFLIASAQIAPVYSPLSVETDESSYRFDETIRISGFIVPADLRADRENLLVIQVFNRLGTLARIDQAPILQNGSYSYSLIASLPLT